MNWKTLVSLQKLQEEFEEVEETVADYGEVVIIVNNQPKYILRPFTLGKTERKASGQEELEQLLNGIGKRVFVTYFEDFRRDADPFMFLGEENFTAQSVRSRMSRARTIFKNGWERDALRLIADSSRVDTNTRSEAQKLLEII